MSSLPNSSLSRRPSCAPRLWAAIMIVATPALAASEAGAQQTVPVQYRKEAIALMQSCRADHDRLCSGVVPGGGRILACLQNHAADLSAACAQSLPRAQALRDNAVAAGALPK